MSTAADQLGIHACSAQRWTLRYENGLGITFEKHEKEGRPRILNKEHKKVSLECVDMNPSVTVDETIASKL